MRRGVKASAAAIRRDYDIEKLEERCAAVIANCLPCILSSRKAGHQEGLLNPISRDMGPFHTLHVDHLGPMPSTAKNYRHLFVVVDGFTKFVWIYPVKNTSAKEVLQRLEKQQEVFGVPVRIVSDRGAAFTSGGFREYCEHNGVQHTLSTTGVPRGNGQVERMNGIIIPALTKLSVEDPLRWHQHVANVQRFINSARSRGTGKSPFELMFGVPMRNVEDHHLSEKLEEAIQEQFFTERDKERERRPNRRLGGCKKRIVERSTNGGRRPRNTLQVIWLPS